MNFIKIDEQDAIQAYQQKAESTLSYLLSCSLNHDLKENLDEIQVFLTLLQFQHEKTFWYSSASHSLSTRNLISFNATLKELFESLFSDSLSSFVLENSFQIVDSLKLYFVSTEETTLTHFRQSFKEDSDDEMDLDYNWIRLGLTPMKEKKLKPHSEKWRQFPQIPFLLDSVVRLLDVLPFEMA